MEHLFSAFVRVLRNLDDAVGLLTTFQAFETNPSGLSAEDRIRLLDFPDLATQVAKITAIAPATPNKRDLLKKAAQSPRHLTPSEIDLLQSRYWGNITFEENKASGDALDTLADISYEHRTETLERLHNFQRYLYEEYEAEAIKNATKEEVRRIDEMREAEKQKQLEIMMQYGQPWLRQLWQEDKGNKPWGYAMFLNPQWKAENPHLSESYDRKSSHSMHMAFSAIASGVPIQSRYLIESLDWPSETPTDDESFPVILSKLRKQFNYLRSYPPKQEIPYLMNELAAGEIDTLPEGLTVGILRNVFLYLDSSAAASVLENRLADDFWIWAVDPDYMVDAENQSSEGYQGYLRVRLQQLIHNFYVARRWHADETSMEDLWKAAQKDPHNGSFVSMKDEEIFAQDSTWEVATALRADNAGQGASS